MSVPKKQRKYYSGKKKRHTIKTQLIADLKTRLVLSVDQTEGCVHDFRIFKDSTGSAVSPDITAKTDSGYQGIATYHANSEVPYKKSKNHPLTPEEKAFNRRLARERIVIEHINREIKAPTKMSLKIMAERY